MNLFKKIMKQIKNMADTRFVIDTSVDRDVWALYQKHMDAFWTPHDITFTDRDYNDWDKLSDSEKKFIESILSFFATADSIVNENLMLKLYEQIESPAGRAFYSFQGAMETIHSLVYAKLLEGYVKDLEKLDKLRIGDINSVRDKIRWCEKWIHSEMSKEERLLIFCCIEGIFFSGAFCAIYWVAEKGILPALCNGNKLIAPDECLHVEHCIVQYSKCESKVPEEKARALFLEALDVEEKFINGAIDCAMLGMNRDLMLEYIKHVTNNIYVRLGYEPLFAKTRQPFSFMDRLCFDPKENFLELRTYNYQRTDVDDFDDDVDI
jgi:ribonucleotide reductase beta subunit family protein with ferritin-like domain